MGRFTLQILGAVAKLERWLIRERVAAGKHCGRSKVEWDPRPALALLERRHRLNATAKAPGGGARAPLRRWI